MCLGLFFVAGVWQWGLIPYVKKKGSSYAMVFLMSSFATLSGCYIETPNETDRPGWLDEEYGDSPDNDNNDSGSDQNSGCPHDGGTAEINTDPFDHSGTPSPGVVFFHLQGKRRFPNPRTNFSLFAGRFIRVI